MKLIKILKLSKEEKQESIKNLIQKSYPGSSFYILMALASIIAAIGLITNNLIIIIGSMLVAPLLYPIIFLGMSIVLYDQKIIERTLMIIIKITVMGILIGFICAVLFESFAQTKITGAFSEKMTLPFFYVAVISGLAASFASARKGMQESLPGIAVSISLIPPLINIGVALGFRQFSNAISSLQLFAVNIFGIIFAGILIFSLMGFSVEKTIAKKTLHEEKKCLKKGEAEFNSKKSAK